MNPSDYRREYAASCSATERERYNYHAGLSNGSRLEPLAERFADLSTRESIDDLQRAFDETPAAYETERAGLRSLAGAARVGYLETRAAGLTFELKRCESSARVVWKDSAAAPDEMPEVLAREPDAARRSELAARWFDALRACDDLRAAQLLSLQASACELGFDGYRALCAEVTQADWEKLADGADAFLLHTNEPYYAQLARWSQRELSPAQAGAPPHADSFYFRRLSYLDVYFAARDLRATYSATFGGLGIHIEKQKNVHVADASNDTTNDATYDAPRAVKGTHTECFGVSPPEEVFLFVGAGESGAELFRNFFGAAGRAQFYAWTSRETAARHPEFIYAPDRATREGYALLFRGLFTEAAWVGEHRRVRAAEAREIARGCALAEMHDARLACARLRFRLALADATDARSAQLAETYTTLHTEATGFRYDAATMLLDAQAAQRAAEDVRARLFAAGLAEHLRGRHGRQWWKARRAGDELIDMWNTAARYGVEELARLVGFGELDFMLLAEGLSGSMSDG